MTEREQQSAGVEAERTVLVPFSLWTDMCGMNHAAEQDWKREGCWSEWDQSVADRRVAFNIADMERTRLAAAPPQVEQQTAGAITFAQLTEVYRGRNYALTLEDIHRGLEIDFGIAHLPSPRAEGAAPTGAVDGDVYKSPCIVFTLPEAEALVESFGGEDTDMVVARHNGILKAWVEEYPEEGSVELAPITTPRAEGESDE